MAGNVYLPGDNSGHYAIFIYGGYLGKLDESPGLSIQTLFNNMKEKDEMAIRMYGQPRLLFMIPARAQILITIDGHWFCND